jgi:DNA-binding transcriptional LysR family regulator
MQQRLHLRDLQCFVLVYELRSVSRTADTLDTTQSQVSTRIHRLEQFVGSPLFARLPHGLAPNLKGEALYPHAKRVLGNLAELEAELRRLAGPKAFRGE